MPTTVPVACSSAASSTVTARDNTTSRHIKPMERLNEAFMFDAYKMPLFEAAGEPNCGRMSLSWCSGAA